MGAMESDLSLGGNATVTRVQATHSALLRSGILDPVHVSLGSMLSKKSLFLSVIALDCAGGI
jgi:hypothetical protein